MDKESAAGLIRTNLYLSSLVSDLRTVDPLLEPLREVTATVTKPEDITDDQRIILLQVRQRLIDYLLTKEQVRVFTPAMLQNQISHYATGGNTRRAAGLFAGVTAGVGAATGVLAAIIPSSDKDLHLQVIATSFFALLHIGAVILFLTATRAFSEQFKTAFRWLCAGITLLGGSLVLQPYWALFGTYDNTWAPLVEVLPVLLTACAAYIGARLFTKPFLANIRTRHTGYVIALAAAGTTSALLPHQPTDTPDIIYRIVTGIMTAVLILICSSAYLVQNATGKLTEMYRNLFQSLAVGFWLSTAVIAYTISSRFVTGGTKSGLNLFIQICLITVMGCAFLYAGYVANKASRY